MQRLKSEVTVEIPSHLILVEKTELQELQGQSLAGVYWNMSDLEKRINKSSKWIKENILYQPRFKSELEQFVYYPQSQGQTWSFQANKMAEFLDKNFNAIFGGATK